MLPSLRIVIFKGLAVHPSRIARTPFSGFQAVDGVFWTTDLHVSFFVASVSGQELYPSWGRLRPGKLSSFRFALLRLYSAWNVCLRRRRRRLPIVAFGVSTHASWWLEPHCSTTRLFSADPTVHYEPDSISAPLARSFPRIAALQWVLPWDGCRSRQLAMSWLLLRSP